MNKNVSCFRKKNDKSSFFWGSIFERNKSRLVLWFAWWLFDVKPTFLMGRSPPIESGFALVVGCRLVCGSESGISERRSLRFFPLVATGSRSAEFCHQARKETRDPNRFHWSRQNGDSIWDASAVSCLLGAVLKHLGSSIRWMAIGGFRTCELVQHPRLVIDLGQGGRFAREPMLGPSKSVRKKFYRPRIEP